MEAQKPPQYILEVFADPTCVKDIVRGVLHTICFHRYFSPIRPSYLEILDFTLPLIPDPDVETLIDTRVGQLIRQLTSTSSPKSSIRGSLVVEFFEKRKKKGGGLGWFGKGDEEVCWESWCLEVTLATPKTEIERTKVTKAIGSTLQKTAMKIITIVNRDKEHIPPLTQSETNLFPFHIELNPRVEGWGRSIGIY